MFSPSDGWTFLKRSLKESFEDDVPQMGAALSYYAAFSMAPLLVIALRVTAVFFGEDAARGEIERQMQTLVGEHGSRAIQDIIVNAKEPTRGKIATAISVVVLLFGASGVFAQLQYSLNTIWGVKTRPGRTWLIILHDRFLSFAMVLCIAFLLLVSLVVSTVIDTVLRRLPESWDWSTRLSHLGVSFLIITLLFAMIFKILPDVVVRWRDVWLGAAVTSLLFNVGKLGIGWYLGQSGMASAYGLAGSFMVLLFWIYYSSQILYLGAEMTQVYTHMAGQRVVAKKEAEPDADSPQSAAKRTAPAEGGPPPTVRGGVDDIP